MSSNNLVIKQSGNFSNEQKKDDLEELKVILEDD
jgi:hypothetical protein